MTDLLTLSPKMKEEWILQEYDFYPRKVESIQSVKKITCDLGVFALKKAKVNVEQISFVNDCLAHLRKEQFPHVIPLVHNKYGDPFVHLDGDIYYVTPWMEHDTEQRQSVSEEVLLQMMGKLHRLTTNIGHLQQNDHSLKPDLLIKRWEERLKEMRDYKQFASSRDLMSPIEESFVARFTYLQKLGARACQLLSDWNQGVQAEERRSVLCFGRFQRKHLVYSEDQVYLDHLEQITLDSPARDLALFYRRHGDRLLENKTLAKSWLNSYEAEFPLLESEKWLLSIYLQFPEGVFKEIELYYRGERDWTPQKRLLYFERQLQIIQRFQHFGKEIFQKTLNHHDKKGLSEKS